MSDVHDSDDTRTTVAMTAGPEREGNDGLLVSRRTALVGGAVGIAAVMGVSELETGVAAAAPTTSPATSTSQIKLPTGVTNPEQMRLTWGADPTTEVTISWSTPGATPMSAPTLAYSHAPISDRNPGTIVTLPATDTPLNLAAGPRTGPTATSFHDGLSDQSSYHYHAPLSGLRPDTQYYYEINDGTGLTAGGQFFTAPGGRAAYRFTAFGDMGTPYSSNPSTYNWTESSDVSVYTVNGVINPGDGAGPGLFHLMLGDLSYANVNPGSQPSVWRDYQVNASAASANQPWMPIMGNHEVELGLTSLKGVPGTLPAAGTTYAGPFYNGPYGAGNYIARHLLPDNGLTNTDGNSLQGSFYKFQVGTVLFICLNTNDVVFQNPQTVSTGTSGKTPFSATYTNSADPSFSVTLSNTPAADTPTVTQYLATGGFTAVEGDMQLLPSLGGPPNLQTQWLEQQLKAARAPGSSVDMIVVCEHHCALSTGPSNGCDMAIRAAWLPLYDEYEVDLVIGGHDHDYEASYPVRGFDQAPEGKATAAFTDPWGTSYVVGAAVNTRRPTVVQTEPTTLSNGKSAWNTGAGTVFLQLGGAGAAAGTAPATVGGVRTAKVWMENQGVAGTQPATEPATWSRIYDSTSNYGYAVFDVDPGDGPGQTKLTYQWFSVPMPDELGDLAPTVATDVEYSVTPDLPTAPYEEFVFMRSMSGQVTISGGGGSTVQVGGTLTATPSGWPTDTTFNYQWLRNGAAISGATSGTYTAAVADDGHQISVQITGSAQSFPDTVIASAAVTISDGSISLAIPTISGSAQVGQILTASANVTVPGAVYAYQWLRNGTAISGATGVSYVPQAADESTQVSVKVTVSAPAYQTTTATSAALTIPVPSQPTAPSSTLGIPVISGDPQVRQTLSASVSSSGGTIGYQWLRDGAAIDGALSAQYNVVAADGGHDLQVRAMLDGMTESALSYAVRISDAHFTKKSTPKIHGSAIVGQTVSVETGAWSPAANLSYQWLLNGQPIQGATHKALKVESSYAGKKLRVRVTGQRKGYITATAVSAVATVSKTKAKAKKPKIVGRAIVGQTLHAQLGEWLPGTDFTYRWYASGFEVPGATGPAFRIGTEQRGSRIVLEVTGQLPGQEGLTARSAETRLVRRSWSWLRSR